MWHVLWPWLLGTLVVVLGVVALWLVLRRPRPDAADGELHLEAIRLWLDGRLEDARDRLRILVRDDPRHHDAYLHLGTLYRLTGDPGRAAAMHRTLAVRSGLTRTRRVTVGLELAADLVDLGRGEEAGEVLEQLGPLAREDVRWYRLRFTAAVRRDDVAGAAQALRDGEKRLAGDEEHEMARTRAAWLTDRALTHVRAGEADRARDVLGLAKDSSAATGRAYLVRALIAAREDDHDRLVQMVEKGLAAHPVAIAPALVTLEGELADAGRFLRVLPALEASCARDDAPPSLWVALARLYEKLGRRDDAIRLLASKRGDPRLTPDAAAPYLRLLTADAADAAFTRVWNLLSEPDRGRTFACVGCGRREPEIRWFCPTCLRADSFETEGPDPAAVAPVVGLAEPPRY